MLTNCYRHGECLKKVCSSIVLIEILRFEYIYLLPVIVEFEDDLQMSQDLDPVIAVGISVFDEYDDLSMFSINN